MGRLRSADKNAPRLIWTNYAGEVKSAVSVTQTGTPGIDSPAGTFNVNDSAWHHYAAVWDGIAGTRQLYVDGTLDSGVNLTGDYGPSGNIASFEYLTTRKDELVGMLIETHQISQDQAATDVSAFLASLADRDLLDQVLR